MPRYPCERSGRRKRAPIISASLDGSDSWIEPPASATRLWASQAPAARGSTVPPSRRSPASRASAGSSRMRGPSARTASSISPSLRLGADVEPAAAHQRVAGEQREVEQQLDRALGQLVVARPPSRARSAARRRTAPSSAASRLVRVDLLAEAAGGAERQAEELQLVGRRPRAVGEQLEALLAHLGILSRRRAARCRC